MATPRPDTYTAASGAAVYGGRTAGAPAPSPAPAPAPAPSGLPSYVPAAGGTAIINTNSLVSVNSCPGDNCWYSQNNKQMAPWRNWTGAAYASGYSTHGAILYWGGGHNGGDDCTIYCFDFTSQQWSAIGPGNPASDYLPLLNADFEDYLFNGSYIQPGIHTYNYPAYAPPGTPGVGAKGAWIMPVRSAPHQVDLETGVWSRLTTAANQLGASPYAGSIVDTTRNKIWWEGTSTSGINGLDMSAAGPRTVQRVSQYFATELYYPVYIYVPEADQAIGFGSVYGQTTLKAEVFNMASGSPVKLGQHTLGTTYSIGYPGYGVDWCPITQAFYAYNGYGETVVHKIKPSSLNFYTATWEITTESFPDPVWDAVTGNSAQGAQPMTRWRYIPALRCFAWSDGPRVSRANTATGISNPGAMQLWRPAGT